MKKPASIDVSTTQFYLANQVVLLPVLYEDFLADLIRMSTKKQLCLVPVAIFDAYNIQIRNKITAKVHNFYKKVA